MRTALILCALWALAAGGCGPGEPFPSGSEPGSIYHPLRDGPASPELLAARAATAGWVTVTSIESAIEPRTGLPFTTFTATVDEGLRGCSAGDLLSWRLLGGTAGGRTVRLHDAPGFRPDERALVLLTEPGAAGWPKLVGLGAGKWQPLDDDARSLHSNAGVVNAAHFTELLRRPKP